MDSKHYLNVKIGSKSTLADHKQKSFESYDSTSSNYSQMSDSSDIPSPLQRLETIRKSPSPMQFSHATSDPSSDTSEANVKRSFWKKTISSIKNYKHKEPNLKRHQSIACPTSSSTSPGSFDNETEDIDPIYHLLRCAATQGRTVKPDLQEKPPRTHNSCSERPRSLSGSQFHSSRGVCLDPKCPCKYPDKLPVVKKEDLGQQAKKSPFSKQLSDDRNTRRRKEGEK